MITGQTRRILAIASSLALLAVSQSWGSEEKKAEKTDAKHWLEREVVWIISQKERSEFKKLKKRNERDEFIERFWRRRDPTPLTERNEYKEEHYRRWMFARKHFQEGIPGWKSDRGRVYILHGPPDSEYFFQARHVMSPLGELKSTERSPDSLVWVYHQNPQAKHYKGELRAIFQPSVGLSRRNFTLGESRTAQERADRMQRLFFPAADPNWINGDVRYRLVMAGPPSMINARGADLPKGGEGDFARYIEDLFRSPGELLEEQEEERARREKVRQELRKEVGANLTFEALIIEASFESFQRAGRDWWIPLQVSIPVENLKGQRVDIYAALLDDRSEVFDEFVDSVEIPQRQAGPYNYRNSFSAPSGEYRLRVIVRDVKRRRSGTAEESLHLTLLDPLEVEFGSVFLTDRIEVYSKESSGAVAGEGLTYGDVRLLPHRRPGFGPDSHLFAYLQFWVPTGQRRLVLGGNFIYRGQIVRKLDPYKITSNQGGAMEYGTVIPMAGFQPGEYVLQFQLLDLEDRRHDFRRVSFTVVP